MIIRIHSNSTRKRPKPKPEPEPDDDDGEVDLIRRCAERDKYLIAWENEFIGSISASILEWGRLTPKQRSVLDRIVNKLKLQGVWDDI